MHAYRTHTCAQLRVEDVDGVKGVVHLRHQPERHARGRGGLRRCPVAEDGPAAAGAGREAEGGGQAEHREPAQTDKHGDTLLATEGVEKSGSDLLVESVGILG